MLVHMIKGQGAGKEKIRTARREKMNKRRAGKRTF